ncbi:MAG: hypothetical protein R2699_07795 [Acidimicrobiales bacterium]
MNQELGASSGIVRKHGQKGAFVSRYVIDPTTHDVLHGSDLTSVVTYFDRATGTYTTTPTTGGARPQPPAARRPRARRDSSSTPAPATGPPNPSTSPVRSPAAGRHSPPCAAVPPVSSPGPRRFSFENLVCGDQRLRHDGAGRQRLTSSTGEVSVYRSAKTSSGGPLARARTLNGNVANIKLDGIATDAAFRAAHDVGDEVRSAWSAWTGS